MMKRTVIKRRVGLSATLILMSLLAGCGDKIGPGTAEVKRQPITGVVVTKVEPSKIEDVYETSGTVKARVSSVIASRCHGVLHGRNRAGGRAGEGRAAPGHHRRPRRRPEGARRRAGLRGGKAGPAMADLTYQRYKRLHDEKALAKQEIDQIETQKKVADANYEQAKAGLEEARIWQGFTRGPRRLPRGS